ncbi:MAG TPA: response regulator transcription factor [Actinomycetota bacterium]|nr:response regulator transcription factor [Actinomycetota bacterium]
MPKVLIVDDHAVVRSGLRMILEAQDDMQVVGEAGSGEDAIASIEESERTAGREMPDVVLMDLMMEGMGGVDATREVTGRWPDRAVLVLTMAGDRGYLREAFMAGASGYVLKDAADVELVEAIRTVAAGGRYLHPSLGAELVRAQEEAASGRRTATGVGLSAREIDVLRLVCEGYANKEIADELFISVRTVETHKSHIMRKTGLRNRSELVRFARDAGIIH